MVLNVLEARSIPGLEDTAWASLSSEQQDLALSVARRALEARGLAATDEQGQLRVHRALLTAVGACTYPQRTAVVEHWPAGATSTQVFAHTRDNVSVVHTAARGIHTFVMLPSEAALANQLATTCEWGNAPAAPAPLELTLPRADFTRVCDASATGAEAEARQMLASAKGSAGAAAAFVRALASGPRVSVVQLLRPGGDQAWQEQGFTIIDGRESAWLVAPLTAASDSPLRARTVSGPEIGTILQRGL